jgi:hypothetical protein
MHGHVFEPKQMKFLDAPSDVDGLIDAPALVDVAHEIDIGTYRFTNQFGALDFPCCRRVTRQGELHLHLLEPLLHKHWPRLYDVFQWRGPRQRTAGIRGNAVAQPAEHHSE